MACTTLLQCTSFEPGYPQSRYLAEICGGGVDGLECLMMTGRDERVHDGLPDCIWGNALGLTIGWSKVSWQQLHHSKP